MKTKAQYTATIEVDLENVKAITGIKAPPPGRVSRNVLILSSTSTETPDHAQADLELLLDRIIAAREVSA